MLYYYSRLSIPMQEVYEVLLDGIRSMKPLIRIEELINSKELTVIVSAMPSLRTRSAAGRMNALHLHAIKTMSRPYDLHDTEITRPGSMMTVRPDPLDTAYFRG